MFRQILITIFLIFGALSFFAYDAHCDSDILFGFQKKYDDVLVKHVFTADTLRLEDGKKVKLIGLIAPDRPKRKKIEYDSFGLPIKKKVNPTETIEEKALNFAQELLEGKRVRLEFDVQSKDSESKTLAYAFLADGTFVNAEILRNGFANLRIMPPNTKYASQLREAYQEARREKRGLRGE